MLEPPERRRMRKDGQLLVVPTRPCETVYADSVETPFWRERITFDLTLNDVAEAEARGIRTPQTRAVR